MTTGNPTKEAGADQASAFLEPDDVFEGVGANRFNPRYDPVDE